MTFFVRRAHDGYRWQLKNDSGRLLAKSSETYQDKRDCMHAIALVKKADSDKVVEEEI